MGYLDQDDILLELARLERAAREAVARRMAAQQLGEAFRGLEPTNQREGVHHG
jgi:hypothetical protein